MMASEAKVRYPAFLMCQKNGVHTPWPGPACVNRDLQPVSVFGGWTDIPQHLLDQCLSAELAAAAATQVPPGLFISTGPARLG